MVNQDSQTQPTITHRAIAWLRSNVFFVLLIPIFFVLHAVEDNIGFISLKNCLLLMLVYTAGSGLVYTISRLLLRTRYNAGLFTAALMSFFLFFGAVKDFLAKHVHILSRYIVLLPLAVVIPTLLFIYLRRNKQPFQKAVLFLNSLFLIYVVVDLTRITNKLLHPDASPFALSTIAASHEQTDGKGHARPDIYMLLMDEYAASAVLRANHGFINPIDSFLLNRGFHLVPETRSNYGYTWNSIASMFNMSYIAGVDSGREQTVAEINQSLRLLKSSVVVDYLRKRGYQFINYSPFDFDRAPSPARQLLLPVDTRLVNDNTLFGRMFVDLGWELINVDFLNNIFYYETANDNEMLRQKTEEYSRVPHAEPSFIYTHLTMPHGPWFYDKNGRRRTRKEIMADGLKHPPDANTYLEYLQYANTKVMSMIDTIQANTNGKAVIVLMGDHGFRRYFNSDLPENFRPLNAVYLPDKKYGQFYDSMSLVNQFPILFNTLFDAHFPLLKDSTIFLPGDPSIP